MDGAFTDFVESPSGRQVVASGVALLLVLIARVVTVRLVRANERMSPTERLRWQASARNLVFVLLVLALLFIWGSELREFVVSLVVLASAIVIATKELLMCISGSLLRATTRSFEVGDRVEVAGFRGDVIDVRLLSTTLLEIGPSHQRTGRTHVVPNSLFLANAVANETFTEDYVLHTFALPLPDGADWRAAEERVLAEASAVCAEHTEAARAHMTAVSERYGLSTFDVTPRVTLEPTREGITLRVRIPTPARERGRFEQDLTRRFLGAGEEERDGDGP